MANHENADDELNRVFKDGSVFDAGDYELKRYLRHLSSEHVPNDMVIHREIIRGLTINTLNAFGFIDAANKTNKKYTRIIIVLSVIAVTVSRFLFWRSAPRDPRPR